MNPYKSPNAPENGVPVEGSRLAVHKRDQDDSASTKLKFLTPIALIPGALAVNDLYLDLTLYPTFQYADQNSLSALATSLLSTPLSLSALFIAFRNPSKVSRLDWALVVASFIAGPSSFLTLIALWFIT
ncbi:MAG: hypothetical protein AAF664_10150 [Planctomycetota bacterium]